jgi:hypothetical protein
MLGFDMRVDYTEILLTIKVTDPKNPSSRPPVWPSRGGCNRACR